MMISHVVPSRTSVPPMFAADEPTSSGPRKDDVPTLDPRDYQEAAKDAPSNEGEREPGSRRGEHAARP